MDENNVSFSRLAMRALIDLSKEDQTRVHMWVDQLSVALKQGQLPKDSSIEGDGATENKLATKITPYDGPLFGVDIDGQVHLVCAFTEKNCSVLTLNMADNLDF